MKLYIVFKTRKSFLTNMKACCRRKKRIPKRNQTARYRSYFSKHKTAYRKLIASRISKVLLPMIHDTTSGAAMFEYPWRCQLPFHHCRLNKKAGILVIHRFFLKNVIQNLKQSEIWQKGNFLIMKADKAR